MINVNQNNTIFSFEEIPVKFGYNEYHFQLFL